MMMLDWQSPTALLAPVRAIHESLLVEVAPNGSPLATSAAQWRGDLGERSERGLGGEVSNSPRHEGEGQGVRATKRLKSKGVFYVTPSGESLKSLPVTPIADPLLSITSPDLAPSTNLQAWLLWKLKAMSVNDYVVVPKINCIIARNGTRKYSILHSGNVNTIAGQSHSECLVHLLTWVTCVCATENTIEKANAAHIYQSWCSHFETRIRIPRREAFLTEMLAYEAEPICIQMPVLFSDMPLWEMLVPQLGFGQFVNVNEICAILARPSRDEYWLLYENHLYEYVREKDDDDKWEQTTAELRDELIGKVRLLMRLQSQRVS
jgi:hypothetical protein